MLDENFEAAVAQARGRTRQNKAVPFLIRDDGLLMPNVPLIAKKQNFRPYHGDVKWSLEQRLEYLKGQQTKRRVINTAAVADDEAPLDIAKATKEELIAFALDEFVHVIEPDTHLNKVRSIVAKLAGVDAGTVFGGNKAPAGLQAPVTAEA